MKLTLVVLAFIGLAAADVSHLNRRPVLDSATQGPNPQDIATPEPEYIDIDLPEPPRPVPLPIQAPVAARSHASAYRPAPVPAPVYREPAPAHSYTPSDGYRYKRPVTYYRRTYRIRY